MRVKSLSIKNLRNISSTQLDLDPSLNCFIGDNGAGKTSILEALSILSKGRSFRTGQISSIIGPDGHNFQVVSKIYPKVDHSEPARYLQLLVLMAIIFRL